MSAVLPLHYADTVQPFLLEGASVRGRMVRLSEVAHTILLRHDYPEAVSQLLAQTLCVAAMLSSNLKQDGIVTIQMRGNGPVSLLVADATFGGGLRGYAELREGAAEYFSSLPAGEVGRGGEQSGSSGDIFPAPSPTPPAGGGAYSPRGLLGEESYFAITYDPGAGMQRYQGVVALEGETLEDALAAYFIHSQQLDVAFRLAAHRDALTGRWVAGGLMLERIAGEGGAQAVDSDAWITALALFRTTTADELLDTDLPPTDLLFRLFHEIGVRAFEPVSQRFACRCSRERMHQVLLSVPLEDRADLLVNGAVAAHCQFCNATEQFSPDELGLSAQ
jgi:molecular chaperone Hsp33